MAYREGDEPVPGYRLEAFLGRGGFGEVWKADGPGGTPAAIKFISLSGKQGLKEFRALGLVKRIRHPNLVPITAFWLKDRDGRVLETEISDSLTHLPSKAAPGQPAELIIAMGLGDRNLLDRLEQCREEGLNGMPADELLDYLEDAARAIDYMNSPVHDLGHGLMAVQHCDIKPQNIMIVGGAAQVCDFGLARALDDVRVTTAAGSPAYGAPECLEGNKPSASTDQYSLAISYVELRTGELPFADQSLMGVINAHLQGQLDLSRLSPPERDVILKATSRNPDQRFPNTQKMIRALRRAVEGSVPGSLLEESGPAVATTSGVLSLTVGSSPVPGYRLAKHIVRGGTNDVWEATAPGGKSVAMLVRRLDPKGETVDLSALGAIQTLEEHPNLADVQAYWLLSESGASVDPASPRALEDSRWLVIAGKLAKGTLLDRLEECRRQSGWGIPTAELLAYFDQIAKAVDFLNAPRHAYAGRTVGLSHGNLRPVNFLLYGDVVRLGNFGRSTLLEGDLTKLAHAVGYEHPYTAPEVLLGRVSRWSDQYGLAIAYVQLRTGRLPFPAAASTTELIDLQKAGRLDLSALTPAEEKVIARATQLEPKKRFPNCEAFVAALRSAAGAAGATAASGSAKPGPSRAPEEPSGGLATAVATAADTKIDPLRSTMPTSAGDTPIDSGLLPELIRNAKADADATATMLLGGDEEVAEADDASAAPRATLMAPGSGSATTPRKPERGSPGWQRESKRSNRGLLLGGGVVAVLAAGGVAAMLLLPKNNTPETGGPGGGGSKPPVVVTPPTPTPQPPQESTEAKLLAALTSKRAEIDTDTLNKLPDLESIAEQSKTLGDPRLKSLADLACRQALARLARWSELGKYPVARPELPDAKNQDIALAIELLAQAAEGNPSRLAPQQVAGLIELGPRRSDLPVWEQQALAQLEAETLAAGREEIADSSDEPATQIALADQLLRLAPDDPQLLSARGVQQVRATEFDNALTSLGAAAEAAQDPALHQSIETQRSAVQALVALQREPARGPELLAPLAAHVKELRGPIAAKLVAGVLAAAPQAAPELRGASIDLLRAGGQAGLLDDAGRKTYAQLLSKELLSQLEAAKDQEQLARAGSLAAELRSLAPDDRLARLVDIERRIDAAGGKPLSDAQLKSDLNDVGAAAKTPGPLTAYADYLRARLVAQRSEGADPAAEALVAATSQEELPPWLLTDWRRRWSYDQLASAAAARLALPESGWLPGLATPPFEGDGAAQALAYLDAASHWAPSDAMPTQPQLLCSAFAGWHAPQRNLGRVADSAQKLLEAGGLSPELSTSLALLRVNALRDSGAPPADVLNQAAPLADQLRSDRNVLSEDALVAYDQFIKPTLAWAQPDSLDETAKRNLAKLDHLLGTWLFRFRDADWSGRVEAPRDEELEAFDRAAQLDPTNAEYPAYRGFARLRQAKPDFDAVEADADESIKRDANSPAGVGLKGQALISRSREAKDLTAKFDLVRKALPLCDQAITMSRQAQMNGGPGAERLETYLVNGSVAHVDEVNFAPANGLTPQERDDSLKKAAELGLEAAELNDTYRFLALLTAGNALEDLAWIAGKVENYDPSIDAFTKAIDHRPTDSKGYFNRGRCYYKRAGDSFQDPKYYLDRKTLQLAETDLVEAARLAPNSAESYYWLGLTKALRDGWAAGLPDLKTAVAKAPAGTRDQQVFAADWAHGAYEAAKRALEAAKVATGAEKQRQQKAATDLAAECREAAQMAGPKGLGYQALLLMAEGKPADAAKLLEKHLADSAAGKLPAESPVLSALVHHRRNVITTTKTDAEKNTNQNLAIAEGDGAARRQASTRELILARFEVALLQADILKRKEADLKKDQPTTAMAEIKKLSELRALAADNLRAALKLDALGADATTARDELLKLLWQQATLDKDKLDAAALAKLRAEALALIEQVQRDPLSSNASRDKARGMRAEFSKK